MLHKLHVGLSARELGRYRALSSQASAAGEPIEGPGGQVGLHQLELRGRSPLEICIGPLSPAN